MCLYVAQYKKGHTPMDTLDTSVMPPLLVLHGITGCILHMDALYSYQLSFSILASNIVKGRIYLSSVSSD